jgi:hypothetical protein
VNRGVPRSARFLPLGWRSVGLHEAVGVRAKQNASGDRDGQRNDKKSVVKLMHQWCPILPALKPACTIGANSGGALQMPPDGYRRLNAIDENAISPNARLQSA